VASVEAIDGEKLYRHYEKILAQSPVELFYVGSAEPEQVAQALRPLFEGLTAQRAALPGQTAFHDAGASHTSEEMDVAQAKLCMGFTTPVTNRDPRFAAMQVLNTVFGAGMTSKLFMNIREKMSLCYAIGSGYYGTKGILTVSAGIDTDKEDLVRREVMAQLEACQKGDITRQELDSAKEAILSSLRGVHDAPGAVEGYYGTAALSGGTMDLESYRKAVEQVDLHQAVEAANSLKLHSSFFLKGVAE
jgi:predicted Zn-dependent peptidase